MCDIPAEEWGEPLNLRTVLVQLDRDRAETRKFVAEQQKLSAEAMKLNRDRQIAPWLLAAGLIGAITGLGTGLVTVLSLVAHGAVR